MKKLISIVLTICMLFSMISVVSATDISEDERLALLSEKDYTYIDINPNIDAFASAEVIRDYAVFEKATDDSAFNTLHTEDGISYRTRIPSYTHSGVEVDGTEEYYYKGIGYFDIDSFRTYETAQKHSPLLYITESFKLSADQLEVLGVKYYSNIINTTTTKMVAADPVRYATITKELNTVDNDFIDYMPEIVGVDTEGENFNVYLKDSDAGIKFKIGPMNDKKYVKNAVDFVKGGSHSVAIPTGVKGDKISVAVVSPHVNEGGSVAAFKEGVGIPAAALMPLEIKYADGTTDTNYVVVTSISKSNDMVASAIVYGDKYADGVEIDYATDTTAISKLAYLTGSGLTLEDVTFPSNVSGGEMNFGVAMRSSQHSTTNYANKINVGTFDIKNKEILSIKFINDQQPGDNSVEGIIGFDTDNGKSKNVRALVPVTVKNGDADKVYFLYVGRITQQPAVFAATVINKSLQDKIDEINARLELVNDETVESECEAIDKAVLALKEESDLVKDEDFNTEKYTIVKDKLLAIALTKVAKVEAAVEGLADTYTYEMKDKLLEVYADYRFLFENGIDESQVKEEIKNKITALYASYEKANALETLVADWDVYSYSMYGEVVKANEDLVEMAEMVSEKTVETVASYLVTATTAKTIDEKIDALPSVYDSSMLEEVLAIEAEIDAFVENGGSKAAFENYEMLKSLIDSAANDVLNADIEKVSSLIKELPGVYSTSLKDKIAEIVEAVESIKEREGQLDADVESKLNKLLAQKDEDAYYITQKLNYTRDVFEDVKAYAGQGYADKDKGVYVYPAGSWSPVVTSVSTSSMALDEVGFVNQLKLDAKNVGTIAGIPYQYGPVISKVHGKVNEPNSINFADCNKTIKIAVEELPYEELYLAAWARVDGASATITYHYADGSTSTEQNLKGIIGGYQTKPKNNDYATMMHETGVLYWRAYSSSAAHDQTLGYGSYSIYVSSHRLTPDDTKALKAIEITVADQDVNVFALTGKVSNSGIVSKLLDEAVVALEVEKNADAIRNLVKASNRYMNTLDSKEVSYNETYASTIQQYKEKYIVVESVECYTDTDNRNITVTFSGAIADECATKELFVLKKDGKAVSDYKVTKISDNVVEITVKNTFDYESVYSLEISENVSNDEKTVVLGTTEKYNYDGLVAVDVKVTYKDNKVEIKVKNNMNVKLDNFVVMVGAFDKDNALVKFEPVSGSLEVGAEFDHTIDNFNTDAEKVTCEIINTLDSAKLLFNQIRLK